MVNGGNCVSRTHTRPLAPALLSWLMSTPADTGARPFDTDLTGRTAMVTGAASGIGAACAVRLAAAGARVIAVDRDEAGLAALTRGTDIVPTPCDLSDLDAVTELPADVDILVNNAGIQHVAPIQDFPPERFDLILRLMLQSPFRLVRQVLPSMYDAGWGRVVNVSSAHGLRASPFKSAYVAAKHGLEGLSKVIALEGAEHGVTSNCVNPAYVRTAAGREADRRPGRRPRHPRVRGPRAGAARARRREAADRAGRGRRPGRLPVRPVLCLDQRLVLHDGRRLDRELSRTTPHHPRRPHHRHLSAAAHPHHPAHRHTGRASHPVPQEHAHVPHHP